MIVALRRWLALLVPALLAALLVACGQASTTHQSGHSSGHAGVRSTATGSTDSDSGLPWIAESALPQEAAHTLAEIRHGGPWDYPRNDNVIYHNNNRVLPRHGDGYYHEYTVRTPGSHSRGPRRIVTGSNGELYWTADHYDHFARIQEGA